MLVTVIATVFENTAISPLEQRTTMRTPMKTQDQPESHHDYRNTVVGFRITQDEQTKLKSIQRTMRTKGIRGTTSDALRMILHTFDIQDWSKALT